MNHRDTKTQREPIPDYINSASKVVVDAAFSVHMNLGPGLLESVYEKCLAHGVRRRGLPVQQQIVVPIEFEDLRIESGLRLDMLVNDCLVVEVKASEVLLPVHKAQLLTYLKLSGHRVGLLINFNVAVLRNGITRMVG